VERQHPRLIEVVMVGVFLGLGVTCLSLTGFGAPKETRGRWFQGQVINSYSTGMTDCGTYVLTEINEDYIVLHYKYGHSNRGFVESYDLKVNDGATVWLISGYGRHTAYRIEIGDGVVEYEVVSNR